MKRKCDIYCQGARFLGDTAYDLTGNDEAANFVENLADPILRVVGDLAKDWAKAKFQQWLNQQTSQASVQPFGYYPTFQPFPGTF